jgi:hypothetical protein
MPRRPTLHPARNPRLDPYRHRAARFSDDSGRHGRFYVQPDMIATSVGGRLWWTRWSPSQEFAILWIETPEGEDTDTWVWPDDLEDELSDWDRGQFRFLDETYRLTWLDDAATQAMRRALRIEDV